jgi:MFS transporter, ACS family, hexuronate transporter
MIAETKVKPALKRIPRLRWWIAGLVFLSTVINYVDRQTLSVLAPQLTKELGISNIEYGWISQAFLIPYTLMYIVSGLLIDRYGVKLIYGAATIWWSVAAMLHATASSTFGLGVFRFLLGTAESANFVAAEKVAAEWYPPKERGTLNGLVQAATVTGALITPPVVVWLSLSYGWRAAFLFTGSLGLIWAVAWVRLYHLPQDHPRITEEELKLIRDGEAIAAPAGNTVTTLPRWLDFFRFSETWGLLVARVISDPVWWFYLFWMPKYLTEAKGLTMAEMGMVVWIPYLAADAGSISGGWYSGRLIGRGSSAVDARKRVMFAAALLMPVGLLLLLKPSTPVTILLISIVLFIHSAWKTNLVTLTVDIFPRRVVASAHGIVATGGGIGGALFTTMAGYLIEWQSYTPVLALMGVLHPIAYLCVRRLVKTRASIFHGQPGNTGEQMREDETAHISSAR